MLPQSGELRFMAEAFTRLAQEYPWRRDGLSLSERRLLAAAPGTSTSCSRGPGARSRARSWATPSPSRRSTAWHQSLRRGRRLTLNETGERLLAGELDYVRLHGIDRWIGGVHLRGHESPWRWDDARETLV